MALFILISKKTDCFGMQYRMQIKRHKAVLSRQLRHSAGYHETPETSTDPAYTIPFIILQTPWGYVK